MRCARRWTIALFIIAKYFVIAAEMKNIQKKLDAASNVDPKASKSILTGAFTPALTVPVQTRHPPATMPVALRCNLGYSPCSDST